jgi:hypothetical protein
MSVFDRDDGVEAQVFPVAAMFDQERLLTGTRS